MGRLIGLVILLAGILGGGVYMTQTAASLIPLRTKGAPLTIIQGTRVYAPYQGVVWWVKADEPTSQRLFRPALIGWGMAIGGIVIGVVLMRAPSDAPDVGNERYIKGARWATRHDLKARGFL